MKRKIIIGDICVMDVKVMISVGLITVAALWPLATWLIHVLSH